MALKRGIVKLDEYTTEWNKEYESEEKQLKELLHDYIIEIHHVGSTAIPGLKAKPIIDILLVIKNLDDIPKIEEILKPYNYENRGKHDINKYFFAKGPEESRSHYLHITIPNSETYYNQLYFKKYLIDHPEYLKQYCELKEKLAKEYAEERPKYTEGKNDFITNVINLAKEEYKDKI